MHIKLGLLSKLVFILFIFYFVVSVEASSIFWSHTYGGVTDETSGSSLVATSDGGYAIAGYTRSSGSGYFDLWLIKTDEFGFLEWNSTYGGHLSDTASSLVETSDGGYAIAGTTISFGPGQSDFWLIKTDAYGNMEWNQTYGGTHPDYAYSLVATSDAGYAIAGSLTSEDVIQHDGWLVKTDAYGNMEWNQTYGKLGVLDVDIACQLVETSDGGYAIAGTQPYHTDPNAVYIYDNFWLVKTDASGNMMWNKTIGMIGDVEEAKSLVGASDGGYAIVGSTSHPKKGGMKLLLVKTDETGYLPENFSLIILSLLFTAILFILINQQRLFNPRSKET